MTATAPRPLVTAFEWVPAFAHGLVRDLRVRWALEEIDEPYDTELFNARNPRPDEYLARQPFDQVPAFREGDIDIFETGAILLYLGEQDERLLPKDGQPRWTALSWLFASLNSVEPFLVPITIYDLFHQDKAWMPEAREAALTICRKRLSRLTDVLDGKEWLAGRFSIADISMITVLNNLRHTDIVAEYPVLVAYKARGEERPAYKRALEAQIADYAEEAA